MIILGRILPLRSLQYLRLFKHMKAELLHMFSIDYIVVRKEVQ